MSVAAPTHGNTRRRGHMEMTTLQLLFLLALAASLPGTVFCQDDEVTELLVNEISENQDPNDVEPTEQDTSVDNVSDSTTTDIVPTDVLAEHSQDDETSGDGTDTPSEKPWEESLSPVLILVPILLVLVIVVMVVGGIMITRRWDQKGNRNPDNDQNHEDTFLHGNGTEKIPMPMFEEDVPSVLELEMEDMEQWMNNDGADQIDSGQEI
ncbi:hypothetical protein UPYG_G00045290 [Umbra pygmaea]|uniref:Transmembrane protein 154 n=1 Tax=Umbra pygmaea TaxID=75934 RepID=A0ABD0YCP4_UMBPY